MTLRWIFAALHLMGLGIGLGAVWARARALRAPIDEHAVRRVLEADTWWGIAALVWVSTGLMRAFGGLEKSTDYYLGSHAFWGKMLLFLVILGLEIKPMVTFTRWRRELRQGKEPDVSAAQAISTTSVVQALLIIGMVLFATAMARGLGGGA